MYNNSIRSLAFYTRGFMGLSAMLAMGLGAMAAPAEAQPFAYVTNMSLDPPHIPGTVSVIDTAAIPP